MLVTALYMVRHDIIIRKDCATVKYRFSVPEGRLSVDRKLPIGIDLFRELRGNNYYYIDKTGIIEDLLNNPHKVNLLMRPRRFGKTLGVSMMAEFFDISKDNKSLFDGLVISKNEELCKRYMNQWPVIFVSLKTISGNSYDIAYEQLKATFYQLCREYDFLLDSDKVSRFDKPIFERLALKRASDEEIRNGLKTLMGMLYDFYGKPVILLIDEYDVPLSKANDFGYYHEMLDIIRAIFDAALKTNPYLEFAVMTGCLRVTKESIFTGVNNLYVDMVIDSRYREGFGFEDEEVRKLLTDFRLSEYYEDVRQWYDGYDFGGIDVYCPWDVMNYCSDLLSRPETEAKDYWRNTSENSILRLLLKYSTQQTRSELEQLLAGKSLEKPLIEGITYDMLNPDNKDQFSQDTLWMVLLLTGYLTGTKLKGKRMLSLHIPNRQIHQLFKDTIFVWASEQITATQKAELLDAFWNGREAVIESLLNQMLLDTISVFDYKEDFYHGYLSGILKASGYKIQVKTNHEQGLGRSDIAVEDVVGQRAFIIETKRSRSSGSMNKDASNALVQIRERKYTNDFESHCRSLKIYGIAFYKKNCSVLMQTLL